ncbi:hypothetical protein ACU686_33075 [Yinghuangia aomiensis]
MLGGTDVMSGTIDNQVRARFTPEAPGGRHGHRDGESHRRRDDHDAQDDPARHQQHRLRRPFRGRRGSRRPGHRGAPDPDPRMPATTLNYLNSIDPSQVDVVTVGGPAGEALNSAPLNWPAGSTYY